MGKKEIKKQRPDLQLNVLDAISQFDFTKTNKYTPFLLKMVDDYVNNQNRSGQLVGIGDRPRSKNIFMDNILQIIDDIIGEDNISTLKSFDEHLTNNRIPNNKRDINSYDSWEDISTTVTLADIKKNELELEKQIVKVLDNDEWLAIRPLTVESSKAYGAGTKWCTTSKRENEYFYRYSDRGVLIYLISKTKGVKYGIYYDQRDLEFSIWNAADRRVDSIETIIPVDLLKRLYDVCLTDSNGTYYMEKNGFLTYGSYIETCYSKLPTADEVEPPENYADWVEAPHNVEGVRTIQLGIRFDE